MRPWLSNWSVAVTAGVLTAAGAVSGLGRHRIPLEADLASAAGMVLAIGFSPVAPLPVLAVVTVTAVVYEALGWGSPVLTFAMIAALYHLALRHSRRFAWTAAALAGGCWWAATAIDAPSQLWSLPSLSSFAWAGLAVAFGDSVRNRRAYVAEVEDRARRAEQSREDEVRHRVAEERLRIARELHDVVAHHMAVINVQAGAAVYALSRQPEAAEPPLNHIRRASGVVLKELAAIVGLLRQPGDTEAEHQPQPGLDRLPELLETFTASGARITFEQVGDVRPLPASGNLAAYRITQEALTNARKHGDGGTVSVRVTFERDRLVIEVSNGVPEKVVPGAGGFGLIGMRERAAAAGGTIGTAKTGQGPFIVRAELPAPWQHEE
ncbi:sensor histidine kinase [Actinoplanes palleronii]|uniref:histidine kinase n=1 Tax=Actinoplanes palleronii TaxID=113570 RepID=A0ABQ4BTC3_9ACTN|nr:sensor histidine kinase [Actinoplanes palleronii]GIE73526.1 two-component sensor histidine kinase [Actinoplanes palleronii]